MSVYLDDGDVRLYHGDVLEQLRGLPDGSVDCIITSPPYYGLRDYGTGDAQIGLEATPDEHVTKLVAVFREARRVLADHGVMFLNYGDAYASTGGERTYGSSDGTTGRGAAPGQRIGTLPPKNLLGMPWRVAFALQADGWILRSDIIWAKPNPMPESVTDRPTKAHEYVFLFAKQPRYAYDADAIREAHHPDGRKVTAHSGQGDYSIQRRSNGDHWPGAGRNARTVWEIATQPFPEAHFATFPEELVRRCLLGGCPAEVCRTCGKARERIVERDYHSEPTYKQTDETTLAKGRNRNVTRMGDGVDVTTVGWTDCGHGDYRPGTVLDPFMGSGTTALVARKHGRHAVGIDLSVEYLGIAAKRLQQLSLLGGAA